MYAGLKAKRDYKSDFADVEIVGQGSKYLLLEIFRAGSDILAAFCGEWNRRLPEVTLLTVLL